VSTAEGRARRRARRLLSRAPSRPLVMAALCSRRAKGACGPSSIDLDPPQTSPWIAIRIGEGRSLFAAVSAEPTLMHVRSFSLCRVLFARPNVNASVPVATALAAVRNQYPTARLMSLQEWSEAVYDAVNKYADAPRMRAARAPPPNPTRGLVSCPCPPRALQVWGRGHRQPLLCGRGGRRQHGGVVRP
jgi:hypothetical protein